VLSRVVLVQTVHIACGYTRVLEAFDVHFTLHLSMFSGYTDYASVCGGLNSFPTRAASWPRAITLGGRLWYAGGMSTSIVENELPNEMRSSVLRDAFPFEAFERVEGPRDGGADTDNDGESCLT